MPGNCHTREEIKRKLRKLKKVEIKIRFGNSAFADKEFSEKMKNVKLVWDDFFDLNEAYRGRSKYSLSELVSMNRMN
ncbi:hypothetical protein [Thermoclostridium stercorarium]|uniref:hypothetical protein n=1 Tax=Thermoclostridium stercorarium TaxID=1510 RepID=UPI000A9C32FF|nr:hypothetical protein [Thermoclostridium stercorarium]